LEGCWINQRALDSGKKYIVRGTYENQETGDSHPGKEKSHLEAKEDVPEPLCTNAGREDQALGKRTWGKGKIEKKAASVSIQESVSPAGGQ